MDRVFRALILPVLQPTATREWKELLLSHLKRGETGFRRTVWSVLEEKGL